MGKDWYLESKSPSNCVDMLGAFLSMLGVVFIAEPEFIFGSKEDTTSENSASGWRKF